jgi:hypothetical protein
MRCCDYKQIKNEIKAARKIVTSGIHDTQIAYRNPYRIPLKFVDLFRRCSLERPVHIRPGRDTEGNLKY